MYFIMKSLQEHCDTLSTAKEVKQAQPVMIIRGTQLQPQEGYVVAEKTVMSKYLYPKQNP